MDSGVQAPADGVSTAGGFTAYTIVSAGGGKKMIQDGGTKATPAGAATSPSHGKDSSERNTMMLPACAGVLTAHSPGEDSSCERSLTNLDAKAKHSSCDWEADDGGSRGSFLPSLKAPSACDDYELPAGKHQCMDDNLAQQGGVRPNDDESCDDLCHKAGLEVPSVSRRISSPNLNKDALMEIFSRLDHADLLRTATASRFFRNIIILPDFRHHYRATHKGTMLGFFVKLKARDLEKYPYVGCDGLSAPLSQASSSVSDLWTSENTRPNSYWPYFELLDSRDGKLLLFAGNSRREQDMFVFYPHARKNRHHQIPQLRLFQDIRFVAASLLPDESTHQYRVITLARRGVSDSKMTLNIPLSEVVVACFSSSAGRWVKAKTIQSFAMPAKQMLRIGSVLVNDIIYFLHPGRKVITVDISSLELATIELPEIGDTRKITSRMSHILCRGPGEGSQLFLVAVSGRNICMYTYSRPSMSWEKKSNWLAPGCSKDKAVKVIGTSESEDLILVKTSTQDVVSIKMETGLAKLVGSCESDEVLVYEQECPAISQML